MNLVDVLIYQFLTKGKKQILKICFDTESKRYTYWMFVDEVSDPALKWAMIRKKDFRKEFNTMTKMIISEYGDLEESNDIDDGEQIAFEL